MNAKKYNNDDEEPTRVYGAADFFSQINQKNSLSSSEQL